MLKDAELLQEVLQIMGTLDSTRMKARKLRALFERKSPADRAHRLPESWSPDAELLAWAAERVPLLDLSTENERFTNYWHGTGKAMVSWAATWRNWMLRASEENRGKRTYNKGPGAGSAGADASRTRIIDAIRRETA